MRSRPNKLIGGRKVTAARAICVRNGPLLPPASRMRISSSGESSPWQARTSRKTSALSSASGCGCSTQPRNKLSNSSSGRCQFVAM